MNTQEVFRVFDACQPTVAQVQEYLERISGHSPFNLIFAKDGKEKVSQKLDYNLGQLVGVVIESTIYYTQVMSKKDNPNDKDVSFNDLFAFGRQIHPKARPLNLKDLKLLGKHKKEYKKLCDMLSVFGYSAPALQNCYIAPSCERKDSYAKTYDLFGDCDGATDIANHLHFYNIMFCADWKVSI